MTTRSPREIAESWYKVDELKIALKYTSPAWGARLGNQIPEDVHGDEFAEWLTKQYQLAMAKGIELARREGAELELECGQSEHARSSLLKLLNLPPHGPWEAIYDVVKDLRRREANRGY